MRRRFAYIACFALAVAAGCSSTDSHPPAFLDDCTHDCDPPITGINGSGGVVPDAGADTGGSTTDQGVVVGLGCVTDPTFGVRLCTGSVLCPGVTVDRNTSILQNCGFVDLGRNTGAADVECLCNGQFLCPITTAANCATLSNLLAQQTDVCSQLSLNRCFDLSTLPTSDAGTCSPACIQSCSNAPVCLTACGC